MTLSEYVRSLVHKEVISLLPVMDELRVTKQINDDLREENIKLRNEIKDLYAELIKRGDE